MTRKVGAVSSGGSAGSAFRAELLERRHLLKCGVHRLALAVGATSLAAHFKVRKRMMIQR